MEPARQVIREFRWREIFPGLMLARVFRSSLRIPSLAMGFFAVLLIALGWHLCFHLLLPENEADYTQRRWVAAQLGTERPTGDPTEDWTRLLSTLSLREFDRFVGPFRMMLAPNQSYLRRACWLIGLLWTLLIGGFSAGVICRMSAFDLSSQERYGFLRSIRFVAGKYKSFVGAPLILLATIGIFLIPFLILGLFTQPALGPIAGVIFAIAFMWAVVVAVVMVAVMFAWPLVWPALSTEDNDSFDAIGAAVGYASQRPLTYLGYAIGAIAITGCGFGLFLLVLNVAESVLRVNLNVLGDQSLAYRFYVPGPEGPRDTAESLVAGWRLLIFYLPQAFLFSAFWTSATAIYLLLRHHVDGAEVDDIYRGDGEDEKPMPKLAREMGLTGEAASMTSPIAPPAAKAD